MSKSTAIARRKATDNKFLSVPTGTNVPIVLKPAAYVLLEEMAFDDREQISMADALGIGRDTLRAITKRDPDADAAMARGHARRRESAIKLVRDRMEDGCVPSTFFYLKAMHNLRDIGQPVNNGAAGLTVNITIPERMAPEEVIKIIGIAPPQIEDAETDG